MLKLEDAIEDIDEVMLPIEGVTSENVRAVQPGGREMWDSPIVTEHTTVGGFTRFGYIIKSRKRLTYAPAVEL